MEKIVDIVGQIGRTLLAHDREAFSTKDRPGKIVLAVILLGVFCSSCSMAEELPQDDSTPAPEVELFTPALPAEDSGDDSADTPTLEPTRTATQPVPTDIPLPTATYTLVPPTNTPTPAYPPGDKAAVVEVIDGDTIRVDLDGTEYSVRYIGIDAPENDSQRSQLSTQANADLVAGQTVVLVKDVSETDQFGRLLRYVYLLDGTFVNAELIQLGFAEAKAYPPDTLHQEEFAQYQGIAQKSGEGLWGLPTATPIPPTNTPGPQPTQVIVGGQITIIGVNKRDEYVDIQNIGDQPVDLAGWRLVSERGDQACNLGGVLQPGSVLRIWALAKDVGQGGFNCGYGSNIWNNSDPDPAALYDNTGTLVDRYP